MAAAIISLFTALPATALTPGVAFSATNLSTWQTDGVVWAIGQSHGKIVAGGDFTTLRPPEGTSGTPVAVQSLAILNAETGAPDTCQLPALLTGGTPTIRAVATSDDGNTVYVGGNFSNIGGTTVSRVAAIDVQTCTVLPLRPNNISSTVNTLAVRGNTLYVGGAFTTVAGQPRQHFAALNATTGALLVPWVADADDTGRGIGISPDGTKVAIGGDFATVNGAASHSIAVVDATTGANLKDYGSTFVPTTSDTKNIFSGTDGRFYVSNEGTGTNVFDGRIALSWDTLDEVWRDTCLGATQATYQYQGALYVASHAHNCQDNGYQDGKRNFFMAEGASTGDLLGWDPTANNGTGEGVGPRSITVASGATTAKDYLWYGGEFTQVNGKPQQGLTRFGPDDVIAPPTVQSVAAEALAEGSIQVRWQASVDPDDSELSYAVFRDSETNPVWTGTSSSVWWKRPQLSFVDTDVTAGSTHTYRVQVSDGINSSAPSPAVSATALAPSSRYASVVRADGPVAYWTSLVIGSPSWVQDSGAATSQTRRMRAVRHGPTSDTDSPVTDGSGSLKFDGVGNYYSSDEYVLAPTTYSIETWIKTSTTTGGQIVGYGNGRPRTDTAATQASTKYDRVLYMQNNGQVRFGVNPGTVTTVVSPKALNDNKWHHVVATQGSAGMALYVDGARVATNPATGSAAYKGVWHVGGDSLSGFTSRPSQNFFKGLIDETAIYPAALSAARVTAHYTANRGSNPPAPPVVVPNPKISSSSVTIHTGKRKRLTQTFVLRLSAASKHTITVAVVTRNGTARARRDYGAVKGTVVFRPGQVSHAIPVRIIGHPKLRRARSYQLRMGQARGATLRAYYVTGTIRH
ncbi:MAG: hypothetical protein JWR90_3165 [Marmoricola sp.]|nr:hypothetical protein [Marmoricola sp.]